MLALILLQALPQHSPAAEPQELPMAGTMLLVSASTGCSSSSDGGQLWGLAACSRCHMREVRHLQQGGFVPLNVHAQGGQVGVVDGVERSVGAAVHLHAEGNQG